MLLDIRKHPDDILEDLPYVSGHYLRSFMDSLNYVNSFDALLPCCALPSWLAGLILFSHLHAQVRSSALKVFDARQINWRGSVRQCLVALRASSSPRQLIWRGPEASSAGLRVFLVRAKLIGAEMSDSTCRRHRYSTPPPTPRALQASWCVVGSRGKIGPHTNEPEL